MIKLARDRNGDHGVFFVHDLSSPLDHLSSASFDMVLCALAMHYVEDWNPTISEFNRLLKPGGQLIISVEHPFFEFNFFKSANYFSTEPVSCTWKGFGIPVEVHSYRRSLQSCLIPITENGFYIETLIEPRPVPEFEKYDARHFKELNVFPSFMAIRAVRKPVN